MKNHFVPGTRIDNADFYHMDTSEQHGNLKRLTEEVANAPDEQKESAKQNLVKQLGVAGKWIGRNSWGASKSSFLHRKYGFCSKLDAIMVGGQAVV